MKTKLINLYRFSELDDRAKDHAKLKHAEACGYDWSEDALNSLKSLAEHFGGSLSDWSIDWESATYSSASFSMPELDGDEIRSRLELLGSYNPETLKGNGECLLTGYCADEDAIDGFRAAFHAGEADLTKLMGAAFDTWIRAAVADYLSQFEDEEFSEMSDANDYWYSEAGDLQ